MIDEFLSILGSRHPLTPKDTTRIKALYDTDRAAFVDAVLEAGLVPEKIFLKALCRMYALDFLDSLPAEMNGCADWAANLPRQFLTAACMVPFRQGKRDMVALRDPSRMDLLDDLGTAIGLGAFTVVVSTRAQILSAVSSLYEDAGDNTRQIVEDIEDTDAFILADIEKTADLLDDSGDAPVIRLVNHMISQGVKTGASDIHIEPFRDALKIRYRIDGILYEMLSPPVQVHASLVSRIKVMAKMNIAEKRVPQDGRTQVRLGNQEIDIRISTLPTPFGERLVMRLLNKSGYFLDLSEFGLSKENYAKLDHIFTRNTGIVLVTGPTGSGKTTTLYAGLSRINSPDKNILTIEDPIEYNLAGIGQTQVNTRTGLTFSSGLRSIVRQDPDIILIGEIRDLETAEIAIQSALTGHLVFSTLHTNDAAGAITRLADLGVEPYLISSSVNTVIAQRLIRVLCNDCKTSYVLGPSDIAALNGAGDEYLGRTVFRPGGCGSCFHTGYTGRQAIFEIMMLDQELKSLILESSDANRIRAAALKKKMIPLRRDGMTKVLAGITTIEEVLRVTQE